MKKILLVMALTASLNVGAQNNDRNYISEKIYLDEQRTSKIANLNYYDGLGNLIDTITSG